MLEEIPASIGLVDYGVRALGIDPGGRTLHWCVTERRDPKAQGNGGFGAVVLGKGTIDWWARAAASTEFYQILADFGPLERCCVEDQFLAGEAFIPDPAIRAQVIGAKFQGVKSLSRVAGAVALAWSSTTLTCAWSTPHTRWKALLTPCRTKTTEEARSAAKPLVRALPDLSPKGGARWSHDREAACMMSLLALGFTRADQILPAGLWPPPSGVDIVPSKVRKPRRKKKSKKDAETPCTSEGEAL